jgi:uncharacterized membrane protein (DUF485 family)
MHALELTTLRRVLITPCAQFFLMSYDIIIMFRAYASLWIVFGRRRRPRRVRSKSYYVRLSLLAIIFYYFSFALLAVNTHAVHGPNNNNTRAQVRVCGARASLRTLRSTRAVTTDVLFSATINIVRLNYVKRYEYVVVVLSRLLLLLTKNRLSPF